MRYSEGESLYLSYFTLPGYDFHAADRLSVLTVTLHSVPPGRADYSEYSFKESDIHGCYSGTDNQKNELC